MYLSTFRKHGVGPLHQFQGEIIHRDGRRERLEFKKPGE